MLENSSRPLTSVRLLSQVPVGLIALSTPRSRIWLCPIVGCTMQSGLVAAQGAGSGVGVQIQCSAPDYLWQLCILVVNCPLHTHTKIYCPSFLPLMLFSWHSC